MCIALCIITLNTGYCTCTLHQSAPLQVEAHTEEDVLALKGRVFPVKSKEVQGSDLYIAPFKVEVNKWNKEHLNEIKSELFTIPAEHRNALQKNYTPFIDAKDGAIGNTGFVDQLELKIGAPIMVIHNIDTSDGLCNGALGILVDVVKNNKNEIHQLVVDMKDSSSGRRNTASYPSITKGVLGRVVLEKVTLDYPLRKRGGKGGATATLVQFPVKLAFGVTGHKMQGGTVPPPAKVALNLKKLLPDPCAWAYVSLSRVKELKQIHIVDSFNPEKIRCSADALDELQRLEKISQNSNPSAWWSKDDAIRIATLNCRGLQAHVDDMNNDHFLKQAIVINLLETSLDQEQQGPATLLKDHNAHFYSVGQGKGIATFVQAGHSDIVPSGEHIHVLCQIIKMSSPELDIFAVYKSQGYSCRELVKRMADLIDSSKSTYVAGDMNIDNAKDDSLAAEMSSLGFRSMVNAATYVKGSHLDHAYFRDTEEIWQITVERFSPFYTDHDMIAAVLKKNNKE